MNSRYFYLLFALTFFINLAFSFYYNSQIVNQNSLYQKLQIDIADIEKNNQILENHLSQLSSIKSLFPESTPGSMVQIDKYLDLNNSLDNL